MTTADPDDPFVVAGESFEVVDDTPAVGVRPVGDETFPDAHVAVHRPSGATAWGASRADAVERVERDAPRDVPPDRTGEIVETPGVLGGAPRVAGSRIGVLHVLDAHEETGSVVEAAAGFVGPLTVEEARMALTWAESHPDEIRRLRDERAQFRKRVTTGWERSELPGETDAAVYRRPGSATFALFGPDEEER